MYPMVPYIQIGLEAINPLKLYAWLLNVYTSWGLFLQGFNWETTKSHSSGGMPTR